MLACAGSMELANYYALIRPLPQPTPTQCEHFTRHVLHAHSWYKHLPFHGCEFAVFLDPNAGGGFTEGQPRLHHTWATRAQYLEQFGHLSYMYRPVPGGPWRTDYELNARVKLNGPFTAEFVDRHETGVLALPETLRRDTGFTLYPFACDNHVFFHRFESVLRRLAKGEVEHPCAALLIEYYRAQDAYQRVYAEFEAECERRFTAGVPCRGTPSGLYAGKPLDEWIYFRTEEDAVAELAQDPERCHLLTANELEYFRSQRAAAIARDNLVRHERATVTTALAALQTHVNRARLSAVPSDATS